MAYQTEALNWVRKYGQTNTDYLTALHTIEFHIEHALEVAETIEDIELCSLALINSLRVLNK